MKLHISEPESGDLILEWVGEDKRFIIWADNEECDWIYVTKNHEDKDDMAGDKLDNEVLELLYNRIGKILGK